MAKAPLSGTCLVKEKEKENPTDGSQAAKLANFASTLVKVFINDSSRLGMKQANPFRLVQFQFYVVLSLVHRACRVHC